MANFAIDPMETILTGQWLLRDGQVVGDEICNRISVLMESHLDKLATDSSGWDILYRDPTDGRFWELTYPQGELEGGGPPQLRHLTGDEVTQKYHITAKGFVRESSDMESIDEGSSERD